MSLLSPTSLLSLAYITIQSQPTNRDRSGSIDPRESALAIQQAGFQLSPQTMEEVYRKFLKPPTAKGLNLEQFIQLSAYLGILRNLFGQFDAQRQGWININFDHLVQVSKLPVFLRTHSSLFHFCLSYHLLLASLHLLIILQLILLLLKINLRSV
jgi:hypothetical protein